MASFDSICCRNVRLCNNNTIAIGRINEQSYVFSKDPLINDVLFEVKLECEKLERDVWGNLIIGITTHEPETLAANRNLDFFSKGFWVLDQNKVFKDGKRHCIYSLNLDELEDGDCIGMLRNYKGELVYYLNGRPHEVAVNNIPNRTYCAIKLFGYFNKLTISCDISPLRTSLPFDINGEEVSLESSSYTDFEENIDSNGENIDVPEDRLRFHPRTGRLVKLSNNFMTAERLKPQYEFCHGVVLTNTPLKVDQLFELRIDDLYDGWTGSIEVGVTTHNPAEMDFPSTMTNMRSGTIMISGNGIVTKGTSREYTQFDLDELKVGDRIGMMINTNNNLHFFINGLDQGVAATNIPPDVWGVVDVYARVIKVTIIDQEEREEQNLISRRNTMRDYQNFLFLNDFPEEDNTDRLLFHQRCGVNVAVINDCRTVHRPNAIEEFNNGVALTNRPLKRNELFEVRLDKVVFKWAGSLEIGVTIHSPTELEFPSTMTNVRSGTWMMTGNGIMHNGRTVIGDYGQNFDRLHVGDQVGVLLDDYGSLHFFVNGVSQGEAASNIPARVYGVIDLYGQATQATILDVNWQLCYKPFADGNNDDNDGPSTSQTSAKVHPSNEVPTTSLHPARLQSHKLSPWFGKNMVLQAGSVCATRVFGKYDHGLLFSSTPLISGELFEVAVGKWDGQWAGSLAIGVTLFEPTNLLPKTIASLKCDTWYIQGTDVFFNGCLIKSNYCSSLEWLRVDDKVGVRRCNDETLHFYINDCDQGVAVENIPQNVFAIVDCHGSVSQVCVTSNLTQITNDDNVAQGSAVINLEQSSQFDLDDRDEDNIMELVQLSSIVNSRGIPNYSIVADLIDYGDFEMIDDVQDECSDFHELHGRNVQLNDSRTIAKRISSYNQGLILSRRFLPKGYLFQIKIEGINHHWVSSLCIGLTTHSPRCSELPVTALGLKRDTWIISGDCVFYNGQKIKSKYGPNLDTLGVSRIIGVMLDYDNQLRLFIDGVDQGIAASNINATCRVVVDLYGRCSEVSVLIEQEQLLTPVNVVNEIPLESPTTRKISNTREIPESSCCLANVSECSLKDPMRTKSDKTNENLQVKKLMSESSELLAGAVCSITTNRDERESDEEYEILDIKSIAANENHNHQLLKQEQNDKVRHFVGKNCDIKTAVNLDNTSIVRLPNSNSVKQINTRSLDNSFTSSIPTPIVSPATVKINLSCEYVNLCLRLKTNLGLPGGYFDVNSIVCYCHSCWSPNKISEFPLSIVPIGWLRLPIHPLNISSIAESTPDHYHTAFFGTSVSNIRKILDAGELSTSDKLGVSKNIKLKSNQDVYDSIELRLSPSIQQIPLKKYPFIDPKTQKQMMAFAAFQVLVRIGSYKVVSSPSSHGSSMAQSNLISMPADATEWVVKGRHATIITALLLKIVPK